MSEHQRRHPLAAPADPGASGTAVIFDSAANPRADGHRSKDRVRVVCYLDVADAELKVEWAESSTGTLRSFSTETITANTVFERDILLLPGRTKVYIATTTDPGNWQVAAELIDGHELSQ